MKKEEEWDPHVPYFLKDHVSPTGPSRPTTGWSPSLSRHHVLFEKRSAGPNHASEARRGGSQV